MAQTHFLPLPNKDLISSIAFNYYGTRLAVASLDHHIYLIESSPDSGKWPQDPPETHLPSTQSNEDHQSTQQATSNIQIWSAHQGPVVKVIWSDPIHGELIASAGTDGTVRIWEEDTKQLDPSTLRSPKKQSANHVVPQSSTLIHPPLPSRWRQQAVLAESNVMIRDLAFSPSEMSFKLASISIDHHLRLYECLETNSLSIDNWNMIVDIDLSTLPMHSCMSLSHLNANSSLAAFSGVGIDGVGIKQPTALNSTRGFDSATSLNHAKENSFAHSNLMSPLTGPKASTNSTVSTFLPTPSPSGLKSNQLDSSGGWALSWCPETYWGDILSVSSGSCGLIRLIKFSSHSQWENFAVLDPLKISKLQSNKKGHPRLSPQFGASSTQSHAASTSTHVAPILSLAWSPPCGRDYHLLAAGHTDGHARIWKLVPPAIGISDNPQVNWLIGLDAELDDHVPKVLATDQQNQSGIGNAGVEKCDWNVTGNVLSTSGSDGKVRIWKMDYTSCWINASEINCIEEEGSSINENGIVIE
ncbi:hypothetical protein O181_026236 [Austropuccinia psidii MF-1]|uniref:Uncharacterized protein n=1 Tax=Austropuccinia psidii MF-1 TaxID=1389203 RepID=A0A9Q3H0B1_9BASI|nr:hypothetical protein [Austropuccinia psidii MF-1]